MLECAQNLACVGAEPLGLTNCLNFGNPEKPGPAWQLDRAVSGLADACEALGVPVVGGNVSLYNEGPDGPIYPTPVVGMVGELPDPARVAGSRLRRRGRRDRAASAPSPRRSPAPSWPSCAASSRRGCPSPTSPRSPPPAPRSATRSAPGRLASAHDVSDGGLACALAESAIAGGLGCRVDLQQPLRERGCSPEEALFGEGPGGFLVSGERAALEELGATVLGEVGGATIEIAAGDRSLSVGLEEAERAWRSLGERLDSQR